MRKKHREHLESPQRNAEREHWAASVRSRAAAVWTDEALAKLARDKTVLLNPRDHAQLFFALGILHRDGTMPPSAARKFYQVNHMVAAIRPVLTMLASAARPVTLVDAACGSSYLSLAATTYLRDVLGARVQMVAFDRNPRVVDAASTRVFFAGLEESVKVVVADASDFSCATAWPSCFQSEFSELDGVMALHACDIASDYALAIALSHQAGFAAVAPCCQAELARKMRQLADGAGHPLADIQLPHMRRELGALMTNLMRVALCREQGYETTALEFVPTEHSAKNTLIRALHPRLRGDFVAAPLSAYSELEHLCGAGITLRELLPLPAPSFSSR